MLFERIKPTMKWIDTELKPLLERHYKEVSAFQDIPLNPDYEKYLEMDKLGLLRVFTMCVPTADDGNALIGYAVFFVNPHIHYSTSLQAVQDLIYIEKSTRGLGAGKKFIAWCDKQLAKDGVQVVYHHVKTRIDFGPLLESLGYRHLENIWGRRLDGQ